ncbi:MAG: cisplatin damage response ATP-dependent DNA ligase [Pseudomonadota bacterium]
MDHFASLLESLIFTPSRNGKIQHLIDYFASTPDPDRGWAVAAITRDLEIRSVKPAMIRGLVEDRMDPELFALSYDYVGDLGETVSLVWPGKHGANRLPSLDDVVTTLNEAGRQEAPGIVTAWFDAMDPPARWALIKLITGGLRIGVAARLVKLSLARFGDKEPQEIEELWHGLEPPYTDLFAWLEGRSEKPVNAAKAPFRPVMLAHALEEEDKSKIDLNEMTAEWKWDGIRVQAVSEDGIRRLYTRTGDDISGTFPDIINTLQKDVAIDGELLIYDPSQTEGFNVRPFSDLQQRLNRKTVSKKMLTESPAFIRAYDLLWDDGADLRALPFSERRQRLEKVVDPAVLPRIDLSQIIMAENWKQLTAMRAEPPEDAIEGVMLKRCDAPYVPGRPKGQWWKWKREPFLVDAVLMYAQRGHGKRSSFYSDYTFGVWKVIDDERQLVPVGKAYHGFTDAELKKIDRFVRDNTIDRFGPVRAVTATEDFGLVFEVAFEGLNQSTRHKSGVAMRFPRINRLRWDKPAAEADELTTLEAMLPAR